MNAGTQSITNGHTENTANNIIRGTYYPHIDGLRAFAVLSVLIYHAFPALCSGGFIGVDIFFVISGYLITKGLLVDLEQGQYSIGNFYVRRIRRIFPAYIAVIVFTLLVGILLFSRTKLLILANTAVSSAFFLSNIYFFEKSGYFAPNAHDNALLNLWSLSVEEQFYLFFPLILAALYKWVPKYLKSTIWILAISSLVLCIGITYFSTQASLAFYWLPFRAWELLAGSLLAIHLRNRFIKYKGSIVFLLIMISSFFWISDALPFPGVAATVPVLCAVALLMGGNCGVTKVIMEHKAAVFIGKISYSLYLFHWPILVFCRFGLCGWLEPLVINCLALFLSFIFSLVSWRYIELPFRRSKWQNKYYYALGGLIIAIALVFSWGAYHTALHGHRNSNVVVEQYWYGKQPDALKYSGIHLPNSGSILQNRLTILGQDRQQQYVLWGDSHAMALSPGFDAFSAETGINGLYINGRHTLLEGSYSRAYPDNAEWIEQVLAWLADHPELRTVILASRWALLSQGFYNETGKHEIVFRHDERANSPLEVFEIGITELCSRLKKMGKNVIILSSIPEQKVHVPEILNRFSLFTKAPSFYGISEDEYNARQSEANEVFRKLEKEKLAQIVWVGPVFFPNGMPRCLVLPGNVSMYYDDDHLAPSGAKFLIEHIKEPLIRFITSGMEGGGMSSPGFE